MGRPVVASASPGAPGCRRRALCLLLLLFLLLPPWGASAWGETCRRWREGHPVPVEVFLCPEKSDGADAWLCCGTCTRTYCCSSVEDWLDQLPCIYLGLQALPTPEGTPAAPQATSQYLWMCLVVSLVLFLYFGCFLLVNCWPSKNRQDLPPVTAAALRPISSFGDPSRPSPLDLHLPYSSCETLLPPSSEEDPHGDPDAAPPSPEGPVAEFRCTSLRVPEDGVATLFSSVVLPDGSVPGATPENQLNN